jgi:hypothetical protein
MSTATGWLASKPMPDVETFLILTGHSHRHDQHAESWQQYRRECSVEFDQPHPVANNVRGSSLTMTSFPHIVTNGSDSLAIGRFPL